ncbi:MAG: hypothetical protein GVY17_09510 [Cyanobacteria bacterium]|nr:hypothetical protein [Cyanobacteria bacterium GSL.Bin21]
MPKLSGASHPYSRIQFGSLRMTVGRGAETGRALCPRQRRAKTHVSSRQRKR